MRFDEFVGAEMAGLGRFAGALTGDADAAEDVLAEALFACYRHWRRVSRAANPRAYVRRVIVNTYLDAGRRESRRRTSPTGDAGVVDRVQEESTGRVDDRLAVGRLLGRLTPAQRAAVVLTYYDDLDAPAVAEIMGCTPGTVRSHLSHARAVLRLEPDPRRDAEVVPDED